MEYHYCTCKYKYSKCSEQPGSCSVSDSARLYYWLSSAHCQEFHSDVWFLVSSIMSSGGHLCVILWRSGATLRLQSWMLLQRLISDDLTLVASVQRRRQRAGTQLQNTKTGFHIRSEADLFSEVCQFSSLCPGSQWAQCRADDSVLMFAVQSCE